MTGEEALFKIFLVLAGITIGALSAIIFSQIRQGAETNSRTPFEASDFLKQLRATGALENDDNSQLALRIGTGWEPITDSVEKKLAVLLPLQDKSQFAGWLLFGCITGFQPHIFVRIKSSRNQEIIGTAKRQLIEVSVPKQGYELSLRGDYENGILEFRGYSDISGAEAQRSWVDASMPLKDLLKFFHRSKNLDLTIKDKTFSIRQGNDLTDAHNRMFEAVASFCIDAVR